MPFDRSRYAVLVESVAEGVIVYDEAGNVVLINDQALATFGLSRAQVEGLEPVDMHTTAVNLDHEPVAFDDLPARATLRTGQPHDMVVGIDRAGVARAWLSVRSAPLDGGGVVATLRDASDLKHIHDLDRAVLDLATSAVEVPAGHLDELLSHALAIMGRATGADRVIHVTIDRTEGRASVTHDWSRDGQPAERRGGVPLDLIPRLLGRLTRRETIVRESRDQLAPDSEVPRAFFELWGIEAAVVVPVMDEGMLMGFAVLGWSVTRDLDDETIRFATIAAGLLGSIRARERAHSEMHRLNDSLDERVRERSTELAHEQERIGALIAALPDLMFEVDPDGVFLNVHLPEGTAFGWPPERLLGRRVHDVIGAEMADDVDAAMARVRRSGVMEIIEYTRPIEGVEHTFDCRLVPRRDGGILAVIRDVTGEAEQARIQRDQAAKLAATVEDLERAMAAKDEFLASISHELRTPLNAILGLTEILLDESTGPLDDSQREALRTLEISGRHLLDLINDLLDLDQLQAQEAPAHLEEVDAGEAGRVAVELIRPSAEQRALTIEFVDATAGAKLSADERRLRQILLNLLDNAVKFTHPGGSVGLQVWTPQPGQVAFAVWDTGVGIASDDHQRIFEPFTQVDARLARRQSGSGLGLATVDRLVTLHGARIELESEPGRGSRFVVTFSTDVGSSPG